MIPKVDGEFSNSSNKNNLVRINTSDFYVRNNHKKVCWNLIFPFLSDPAYLPRPPNDEKDNSEGKHEDTFNISVFQKI
jgi:hypothetical protein